MKKYSYRIIQVITIVGLVLSGKYISIDNILLWFLIILAALELWNFSFYIKYNNKIERN
jgi:hypothetical protein